MDDHTNTYEQDEHPFDQQELQQQQQYKYPATDLQPSQTLIPDYVPTGATQALTFPAITDTIVYHRDAYMEDVYTYSGYDGRPAGSYESYKHSSSDYTHTTSFHNVKAPVPTIDGSFSSYEMVSPQSRRYSDNSNRTSGQASDGLSYSAPGDPEPWIHGSEYAVDKEAMQEDDPISSMPHLPQEVLVGLLNPEPRTVPNPYELVNTPGPVAYPVSMANYTSTPQPQMYTLPSRPAKVQSDFNGPWNHVNQRMPDYPSGYVAFAPSPGPLVDFYIEHASAGVTPSPKVNTSSPSREKRFHPGKTPSAKGKDRSAGWEHTVVAKGGLQRVVETPEEEQRKKGGVRTGALDPIAKEKARRIRQMRACWNCWVQKVPCSEGETCDRCQKHFSPSAHQLCCRSGFKDYESTLFPEFMHSHLKKSKIEDLISENTTKFLDTIILVEVSTGSVFRPMRLHTNFFEPKTDELLQQASLTPAEPDQASQLVRLYSAPVGILALSLSDMKKKCQKHIEEMIRNPQYVEQVTSGDVSQLPKQILEIVCAYSNANKDVRLLGNALKLHAIHYFMSNLPTFSERSTREIYNNFWPSSTPPPYLSSRLLNRQIKYAMHKLHQDITVSVLEDLERSLRTRTKDSWGPSLCAILLLCLCIESVQSAADIMVVTDMMEKGHAASYTRDQSWVACQELDEYPFKQCKKLFHDIYKSHKDGNAGGRGDKAFNPLKTAAEDVKTGLDSTTAGMVRLIHGVVCNFWTEIMELSENPPLVNLGGDVHQNDIRANNTGRLVAKFLKSFFFQDD